MTNRNISRNATIDLHSLIRGLSTCLVVLVTLLPSAQFIFAQSAAFPVGLPSRAPGYEHYYRSEQASTVFATRWGYFDGYQDGKHDRELGKDPAPMDQDRFKLVPDHGTHPEIPRATYKNLYRQAYLQGYGYGSK
jgi:hypothetical protein